MSDFEIKRGGEPPRQVRTSGRYRELAQAAREIPGEWVHAEGLPSHLGATIRRGAAAGFEPDGVGWFEATARGVDQKTKRCTLWVRYHTGPRPQDEGEDA